MDEHASPTLTVLVPPPIDTQFLVNRLVAERLHEFSRGIHASGLIEKEFACRGATPEELLQSSLRDERVGALSIPGVKTPG